MNPWATLILGALLALCLRALLSWLWARSVRTGTREDVGDAAAGDTRIDIFEVTARGGGLTLTGWCLLACFGFIVLAALRWWLP